MTGGFVLVVGPSGAGKDTLLAQARKELAACPQIVFPRRLVTRASSVWEEHDTISDAAFERGVAVGRFALAWRAHGHGYAIPGHCLDEAAVGRIVVCNVSRMIVETARQHLPNVSVVEITAPRDILAARLAGRARSDDADLGARLERSKDTPLLSADVTIVNDRAPDIGAGLLVGFLQRTMDSCLKV
ncbi:ribose 1,5-bisphosphokinase [Microvirga flocculans]|uniref:ribose 1,5-bisphosphate phosphokinase n=1 Tax=Microvirga flocculans TaxID=217168 RepID=A0A7W6IBP7_9HYPH|nr:phosphonate metabolism protein/1,5-bisphosphokinase (PRPP-forming) PhnN [Microvirga flocculans]MBB4038465.1 ribose 1,5-bisphosphokinase [Microvirga flocculans]